MQIYKKGKIVMQYRNKTERPKIKAGMPIVA